MMKRRNSYELKDTVKCAGVDISLEDLRSRIQASAQDDSRFNKKGPSVGCGIWVVDVIQSSDAWKAVIQAADGCFYEVGFTPSNKKISLADDCVEVSRKTSWIEASFKFNGKPVTIKAAHGEVTGKPSFNTLMTKVNAAIQDDPRFDTDSHGYPEGSDYDKCCEPWCCDILVPDDDGAMEAVCRTDDRRLVRIGFTWDGTNVVLADGDPAETEVTSVYASQTKSKEDETDKVLATLAKVKISAKEFYKRHNLDSDDIDSADIVHCRDSVSSSILRADSKAWSVDESTKFQYMPGGLSTITAGWNNRSIELTVECDEDTAKAVQASLESWQERFPKQKPFGCVEHREEEAALYPESFEWSDDPEPGVYCTAEPSELGARNVNGKIHRSWSPSFTTDAEYNKAKCDACSKIAANCKCSEPGCTVFPKGARGHKDTPAKITGVAFSIGSLTNRPAFKNILPVRAKQAEPQPENKQSAETNKGLKMKVKFIKARANNAAGSYGELDGDDLIKAFSDGSVIDEASGRAIEARDTEMNALKATQKAQNVGKIEAALQRAITRGAILPKGTEANALETVKASRIAQFEKGTDADVIVELIDYMPGKVDRKILSQRQTNRVDDDKINGGDRHVFYGDLSVVDATEGYIKSQEPATNLVRAGNFKDAFAQSRETGLRLQQVMRAADKVGGDFLLRDAIQAADYTDPNSQVGTLATGLVLMRNLGFLKNKLSFLPYISTDLRNEPASFGQPIFTRYLAVPGVLTFIPGIGFTSDATAISTASAGTNQSGVATQTSGTRTPSVPSATDKTVTINQFKGVEIVFPITTLAGTMRNLFAEQRGAQIYGLAEKIHTHFLDTVFAATWTGTVSTMALGANFALPQMVKIKNRMTLSKIPDIGRFVLLHSTYNDQILQDASMLSAKAILALINKDASSFNSGEVPPIFGLTTIESQLASYNGSTATAPAIDATSGEVDFSGVTRVGFAGNMSSMLFAARVPQDFTQAASQLGIPASYAVEIVTDPESGLSLMLFKYIDAGKLQISTVACLMWGAAQGDPRIGILLTP